MKNEKGFSLVEVMIGLTILSIGLMGIAELMILSIKNNAYANHLTEASTIAQTKLEAFRSTHPVAETGSDTVQSATGITFTRSWSVTVNGEMKTIRVTVEWTDKIKHSIELSTIIG
jgi:type IV pilus assembly protein PilV